MNLCIQLNTYVIKQKTRKSLRKLKLVLVHLTYMTEKRGLKIFILSWFPSDFFQANTNLKNNHDYLFVIYS